MTPRDVQACVYIFPVGFYIKDTVLSEFEGLVECGVPMPLSGWLVGAYRTAHGPVVCITGKLF